MQPKPFCRYRQSRQQQQHRLRRAMEGAHQGDPARRGGGRAPGPPPHTFPGLWQQPVHLRHGGSGQIPGGVCSQGAAASLGSANPESKSPGQQPTKKKEQVQQKVESKVTLSKTIMTTAARRSYYAVNHSLMHICAPAPCW